METALKQMLASHEVKGVGIRDLFPTERMSEYGLAMDQGKKLKSQGQITRFRVVNVDDEPILLGLPPNAKKFKTFVVPEIVKNRRKALPPPPASPPEAEGAAGPTEEEMEQGFIYGNFDDVSPSPPTNQQGQKHVAPPSAPQQKQPSGSGTKTKMDTSYLANRGKTLLLEGPPQHHIPPQHPFWNRAPVHQGGPFLPPPVMLPPLHPSPSPPFQPPSGIGQQPQHMQLPIGGPYNPHPGHPGTQPAQPQPKPRGGPRLRFFNSAMGPNGPESDQQWSPSHSIASEDEQFSIRNDFQQVSSDKARARAQIASESSAGSVPSQQAAQVSVIPQAYHIQPETSQFSYTVPNDHFQAQFANSTGMYNHGGNSAVF